MEGVVEEQQQAHAMEKKAGLRLIPVIIANEVSERIVSASVGANLIIYLTTKYHLGAASSAIIIFVYLAAANFLPVCGAIVSDALLGRYLMVTLTLFSCTIGTTLLCLTSVIPSLTPLDCNLPNQGGCASSTPVQIFVLCASLGFMALGASGVRPCCLAFAEDQIAHWDEARKDRALRALFSWYYVSVGFSQIVAITVLVYLQDKMGWKVGFMVSAAIMASVTLVNLAVSPFYVKVKPQKSMWAGLVKVVVVAVNNRHLELPGANHGVQFHSLPGSTQLVPSEKMRFLNKACIVRSRAGSNADEEESVIKSTCTVEQVENLKSALSVMPMWSAMVMSFLLQSSSFGVLQAATMDRRIGTTRFQIPAGSISIFDTMTFTVWSGCYDSHILPLLRRVMGRQRVLTLKQRMGIGLFLAVASTAVASAVEARRRGVAARMSALWLAPQYVLMGLSGAFGAIAQIEFYYAVLPKSMGSFVLALLYFGAGVANIGGTVIVKLVNVVTGRGGADPWISDDLDRGRYDLYYLLLAVLGAVDFVYFVACAYLFHETTQNTSLEAAVADGEAEEMVELRG
ncbi:Protein NRT1/ PTR FAMILY 1.2 [Dichanthelium oligosanthes]|uniref:Protein NRT1/ PTR FAMILY 1.2 n=1 Tax=Dichanthelium oligosanthes TaxID=888268 RepID=A0A1E5V4Z7_9POAL|nr:Protein NRT1/ PTR FAMILY 1.2 [Dichanthelium oligosanthes]